MPYRVIAALAAAGVADTAYLTAVKLLHLSPACPLTGGCADVLTSDYATLFGAVPLAFVGLAAYAGMGALALRGAAATAAGDDAAEAPLRTAALAGGLAMASCSSFLLYLLATQFPGETCPWCLGSAALSFSIAGAALSGMRMRELEDAAAPGAGVVATTLLLCFVGLGSPDGSLAAGGSYDLDYAQPAVTTQSPPNALSLAERLREGGARMYGAFWCSHCYDQKQTFGAEAMAAFPYVECYPEGLHKDTKPADVCLAAPGGLTGFPTWIMPDGQQLIGEQSFDQLEKALDKALAASGSAAVAS
ncbi:thiol-disulfide oxidoreductase LTO1 [Micractinium conductrix]|uniref:Thiol-disulfide oxidoreductase LTO1 n=1 Tax=Micractinium conductrix TaxID=554055 RepID=A0A2P6VEP5_9CHLO|nr:thiol-disulfide oxidoreductase LTO1 [Micractinium conductrix]|eukprot:PSC72564.1 thiol-disulfide oxidoreductase LTO1 [Micractinium conductrix]